MENSLPLVLTMISMLLPLILVTMVIAPPFPDQMSDPSTMPKDIENWNDPQGMPWLSDVTLVFNI
jgi:hypothetical protein